MDIPIQQSNTPDILSFGFKNNLNRPIQEIETPLVYDIVNDRLSQNIPANNTIFVPIIGLKMVEL